MRATALLCLAVLMAGCSDDPEPMTAFPIATTTATPSPTADPQPTATPTLPPAASPTRGPAVDADVDGDGRPDTIRPVPGRLSVTMTSTGKVVSVPVTAEVPGVPKLLGTADVDRDGRVEVFLETGRGASTAFATPYRFDGVRLREVQLDGSPARLGLGGTVTHGEGFRCRPDGRLEVLSAQSADGERFTVTTTTYRLTATALVETRRTSTTGKQGDPFVNAAFTADCGAVNGE